MEGDEISLTKDTALKTERSFPLEGQTVLVDHLPPPLPSGRCTEKCLSKSDR